MEEYAKLKCMGKIFKSAPDQSRVRTSVTLRVSLQSNSGAGWSTELLLGDSLDPQNALPPEQGVLDQILEQVYEQAKMQLQLNKDELVVTKVEIIEVTSAETMRTVEIVNAN